MKAPPPEYRERRREVRGVSQRANPFAQLVRRWLYVRDMAKELRYGLLYGAVPLALDPPTDPSDTTP